MLVCHGLALGYFFKYERPDLMANLLTSVKIAISGKEQMGALFLGLSKVLYLIDRCKIYEILYINRPQPKDPGEILAFNNLTAALVELYAIILMFLAKSNGFLGKSTAQRSLSAFLNPADVVELEKKCSSSEQRVETEAGNCERYCRHNAQSEQAQTLMKLLKELEGQRYHISGIDGKLDTLSSAVKSEQQNKILSWASEIQFEKIHNLAKDGRTADTGNWLLEHKEFQRWCTSDQSKILWLHGIRKFIHQPLLLVLY
jgi:hypothetical protein